MRFKLHKIGDRYKNFTVTKYFPIEEIQCTLIEMQHEITSANIMHIQNNDDENLFSLSFQTLPTDSTGAAHILEHTVLCGSKKFPIKDPFFAMTRRSLNTFMNAMTGSDFTCYPASSQVEKDFYNLLEVYLDAVFHPNLKKMSFLQEGHRLELTDPSDLLSPLSYKGVVYNEMKGVLNSGENRLWYAMMKNLLPDLPYAYNSGGDPKVIPQLTYEELLEFHKYYYHPSCCLFFFYGNLPLEKHLDFIEKHALKGVVKSNPIPPITKQLRFQKPKIYQESFPIAEKESTKNKTLIAFGYLTSPISDQTTVLALSLIDSILMDTDASPLKYALQKSNLCSQANSYLDIDMSEIPWIIICRGCEEGNEGPLNKVIKLTLQKIVEEKIPQRLIDAAIHQLEFSRSEIRGENIPYGLTLFMRSALLKQHGCPPENALAIHSLFKDLRKKTQNPSYLTDLINKYFIKNPHQVILVMTPDPKKEKKELAEEKGALLEIQKRLTTQKKKELVEQSKNLKTYQQEIEKQSLECLPKLELEDIPPYKDYPIQLEKRNILSIYRHSCFTNNILYADLIFPLPKLTQEELFLVALLSSLFAEVGCGDRDYIQNLEYIHAYTGGATASLSLNIQANNPNLCFPSISFGGKALYRNSDKLLHLLKDMAISADLTDTRRIKELLLQQYTLLENALNTNAMSYAIHTSLSNLSIPSKIYDHWHGLSYFQNLKNLIKDVDNYLPSLVEKLQHLQKKVSSEEVTLILGCDEKHYQSLNDQNFFDLSNLKAPPYKRWTPQFTLQEKLSRGYPIASPVAFTSMGYNTIGYMDPLAPPLFLSSFILAHKILHPKIREQKGAYGCGSSYSPLSANFYFYSFRDPHLADTLATFKSSIKEIAAGNFDAKDIEQAKLTAIQKIDAPISPGNRATTAYFWLKSNKTKELREKFRKAIISSSKENIQKAVEKNILQQIDKQVTTSFASNNLFDRENKDIFSISSI